MLWFIARQVTQYYKPDREAGEKTITTLPRLEVGDKFTLKQPIGDLKVGYEYELSNVWTGLKQFRVEGDGTDYCLKALKEHVDVNHRTVKVDAYTNPVKKPMWKLLITLYCVFVTLHTLLPTRQTAIYMAGAYITQQVVTHEKTKELGNKAYSAAIKQLEKWAEEVPELKDMAAEIVESELKSAVEGE